MVNMDNYQKTFTSYSGADITPVLNGVAFGDVNSITYSVTREKTPVYTMGSPNPRSFSRGKRGIAGSMVFTVFDKDSLKELKSGDHSPGQVVRGGQNDTTSPEVFDSGMNQGANNAHDAHYSDEIPPFEVSINFTNEYGSSSEVHIYGVEILNEGMGMSVDDISTEKSCTFVARELDHMASTDNPGW